MTDRICDLSLPALPNPPAIGNFTYHKVALAQHVNQMMRAQDSVLTPGRRVILDTFQRGNPLSLVTDIDFSDDDYGQPGYAIGDAVTIRKMEQVPITPGHFLKISARVLPSGRTREVEQDGSGDDIAVTTGDTGRILLGVTWDDGSTTQYVETWLQFDAEETEYGHAPDMPGLGFAQLREKSALNFPGQISVDTGELVTWTQGDIVADIQLKYYGGLRPVDVCVHEVPYKIARAEGIPAGPAHIYQDGAGIIETYPDDYPIEGASSGDQRFGAKHTLNVAAEHQRAIGPTILNLGRETGAVRPVGSDPAPFTITSTTFAPLDYAAPVGGGAESPSFDFSVGSFGRRIEDSDQSSFMSASGVCRVLVAVQWKATGGTATMRFKTADWSYVDLETTSTSYVWTKAIAHLECGQTVLDRAQLDVVANITTSQTGSVLRVMAWQLSD